jgi:hypothetical protein
MSLCPVAPAGCPIAHLTVSTLLTLACAAATLAVAPACTQSETLIDCDHLDIDPQPRRPHIESKGGPVLPSPRLLAITFRDTGDEQRDHIHAFARWVVGSDWLTAVGGDYGVGRGQLRDGGDLDENSPGLIDDSQIQTWLQERIASGQLPEPSGHSDVFMIFYPRSTTVTHSGEVSCANFSGYHGETVLHGAKFAYAVVNECPATDDLPSIIARTLRTASHELIEAATDPFPYTAPAFRVRNIAKPTTPWNLVRESELADLCQGSSIEVEDPVSGYTFTPQRSWSNSAADRGEDPCVPHLPGQPSFEVMASPAPIQKVHPGDHVTVQVSASADDGLPLQSLLLSVDSGSLPVILDDPFNPHGLPLAHGSMAMPGAAMVGGGGQVELKLVVGEPSSPHGSYVTLLMQTRYQNQISLWPVTLCIP